MHNCKVCYNDSMKTIKDIDLKDKTILVRVDYNIPVKDGKAESDLRIRASQPTIDYLLEHGVKKIILISHLGRPEGKENPDFTLKPAVDALKKLYKDQNIVFNPLPKKDEKINLPEKARIIVLENLRFDPREEENNQ